VIHVAKEMLVLIKIEIKFAKKLLWESGKDELNNQG
jgi:hypothetical protein